MQHYSNLINDIISGKYDDMQDYQAVNDNDRIFIRLQNLENLYNNMTDEDRAIYKDDIIIAGDIINDEIKG